MAGGAGEKCCFNVAVRCDQFAEKLNKPSNQSQQPFFEILLDLNEAVPNHLADKSQTHESDKISKTFFRVGGPQSPFSISSHFTLVSVLLPFFLKTKIKSQQRCDLCVLDAVGVQILLQTSSVSYSVIGAGIEWFAAANVHSDLRLVVTRGS